MAYLCQNVKCSWTPYVNNNHIVFPEQVEQDTREELQVLGVDVARARAEDVGEEEVPAPPAERVAQGDIIKLCLFVFILIF